RARRRVASLSGLRLSESGPDRVDRAVHAAHAALRDRAHAGALERARRGRRSQEDPGGLASARPRPRLRGAAPQPSERDGTRPRLAEDAREDFRREARGGQMNLSRGFLGMVIGVFSTATLAAPGTAPADGATRFL